MKRAAIIVAGGSGKRMGSGIPKQFLLLKGRPLLLHTLNAFHSFDRELQLIVVLPADHHGTWSSLVEEHGSAIPHLMVAGGKERWHSVKAGLDRIEWNDGIVGVHDGVRPLVSRDLIAKCYSEAEGSGAAIPVIPINSSVRRVQDDRSVAIDRTPLRAVQTPQCFRIGLLREAFELPFDPTFTDEATMIERLGRQVTLVEGEERNMKVTTPIDLKVAETLMG